MKTRMNPEVKEKWLKALRGGHYKQTKRTLKNSQGYCCLGVLCNIYAKETKKGRWVKDVEGFSFQTKTAQTAFLLPEVQKWAKLCYSDPIVKYEKGGFWTSLASLNDRGKTFKEIADIIEREL